VAIREELILDLTRARADAARFEEELAQVTLTVGLDEAAARSEFDSLTSRMESEGISLEVTADTVAAASEIEGLDPDAPIEIPVAVDTTSAVSELEGLEPEPIEVPVTVDTTAAETEIENLDPGIIEATVTVDTTSAESEIAGLGGQSIDGGDVEIGTEDAQQNIGLLGVAAAQAGPKLLSLLGRAGPAGAALGSVATAGTAAASVLTGPLAAAIAVTVGGFLALKEGAEFFTENVDEAASFEQAMAKALNVFTDLGPDAVEQMTDVADSLLLSDTAALQMGSTLGNLFIAMGLTGDEALGMSTDILQLAADLSSFNDVPVDDVLLALRAGLIGETEPLRRFGIALSQERLELAAVNQGIIEHGETLTAQQAVLLRYQLIMEDTALAHGDVARSLDQLTILQAVAAAEWENLHTQAGQFVLPAFADVQSSINDDLIPAFEGIVSAVGPVVESLANGVGGALGVVIHQIANVIDQGEDYIRFLRRIGEQVFGDEITAHFLDIQAQLDEMMERAPDTEDAFVELLDTLDDPRWGETGFILSIAQLNDLMSQAGLVASDVIPILETEITRLQGLVATGIATPADIALLENYIFLLNHLGTAIQPDAGMNAVAFAQAISGFKPPDENVSRGVIRIQDAVDSLDPTRLLTIGGRLAEPLPPLAPVDTSAVQSSLVLIDGVFASTATAIAGHGADAGSGFINSITTGMATAATGLALGGTTQPLIDGFIDPVRDLPDIISEEMSRSLEAARGIDAVADQFGIAEENMTPRIESIIRRVQLFDQIPGMIQEAADGVGGAVEQLTTTLTEGGEPVKLSADQFLSNLDVSVEQASKFGQNLRILAKRGQEELAEELRALGPAAADITEDFVEDVGAAREGERILSQAGEDWTGEGGLKGALRRAMGDLEADSPLIPGMIALAESLEDPTVIQAIADATEAALRQGIAAGAARVAGIPPPTVAPPPPPPPTGGPGGSGPPATGRPGAEGGPTAGFIPTAGANVNLTINNPVAQSIEEESGRLAQVVGSVASLVV
jgi:hypothetical protein